MDPENFLGEGVGVQLQIALRFFLGKIAEKVIKLIRFCCLIVC